MPRYELMYLLGSHIADTEVPALATQVLKFVEDFGGTDVKEEQLGKKKLAYPIKKTRNGYYVVVEFTMDSKKINEFDAKIHTQDQSIIRYLMVNLDEHLERKAKDEAVAAKMPKRVIPAGLEDAMKAAPERIEKAEKKETPPPVLIELDEKALDEKIEAALSEDLTK